MLLTYDVLTSTQKNAHRQFMLMLPTMICVWRLWRIYNLLPSTALWIGCQGDLIYL